MGGVGNLVDAGLDRRALDLVCPTSVVLDGTDGHGQVGLLCPAKGLAVVERLESGELILVLLHQRCKLVEEGATGVSGCVVTPDALEGDVGSVDGGVDVLLSALGDTSDDLAIGGVDDTG